MAWLCVGEWSWCVRKLLAGLSLCRGVGWFRWLGSVRGVELGCKGVGLGCRGVIGGVKSV